MDQVEEPSVLGEIDRFGVFLPPRSGGKSQKGREIPERGVRLASVHPPVPGGLHGEQRQRANEPDQQQEDANAVEVHQDDA